MIRNFCLGRWDFLQGESAMQGPKSSSKSSSSKMFRRKLQKRLMHTKQQLMDFQVRLQAYFLLRYYLYHNVSKAIFSYFMRLMHKTIKTV